MTDTPEKPERDDEDEEERDDPGYSDQDQGWILGDRTP